MRTLNLFSVLVASLVTAPQACRADTITSTFLAGQAYAYPCCGDSAGGFQEVQVAAAFTPGGNYALTQIDVAILSIVGQTSSAMFNLSLNEDASGLPGATIESWTGLTAVAIADGNSGPTASLVDTVLATSSVALSAGTQYWIVASPVPPQPLQFPGNETWQSNAASGATGGTFGANFGASWEVTTQPDHDLAFDVLGTATPEPGTLFLLSIGLLGMARYLKRCAQSCFWPAMAYEGGI
jgi:hypothetical protein